MSRTCPASGVDTRPLELSARRFALNWVRSEGAEHCISNSELAERVEGNSKQRFVAQRYADLTVEGHIGSRGHEREVRVALVSKDGAVIGERSWVEVAENCRALDDAILLVVSGLLDRGRTSTEVPAEYAKVFEKREATSGSGVQDSTDAPKPQVATVSDVTAPPDTTSASSASSVDWSIALGVQVGASAGWVPHTALNVELATYVRTSLGWFGALHAGYFPQTHAGANGTELGVSAFRFGANMGFGGEVADGSLLFQAAVSASALYRQTQHLLSGITSHILTFAPGLRVQGAYWLTHHVALTATVLADAPLSGEAFGVERERSATTREFDPVFSPLRPYWALDAGALWQF